MINTILAIYLGTVLIGLTAYMAMIYIELDKYIFDPSIQTPQKRIKEVFETYSTALLFLIPVINLALIVVTITIIFHIVKNNKS
jgi:hypothetical protein